MKKFLLLITAALTFAACGKEIVDLTKELQKDVANTNVDFTYSISGKTVTFQNASDSKVKAIYWDFGDDNSVLNGERVTHTYLGNGTYKVTMQGEWYYNSNKQHKTCEKYITIGGGTTPPDPVETVSAYFEYSQFDDFHGVNITDGSTGVRAVYDFGDGTATKEITLPYDYPIFHSYTKNGTYTIKCTAYGSNGTSATYSQQITVRDPKVYITGIEYVSVDQLGKYYRAVLKDDDFFTTTWFKTDYTGMPITTVPYTFVFSNPIYMNGLQDDDYYILYVYYSNNGSGDGTQCLKQNIVTQLFTTTLPYIEIKNNSGNTIVRLLMDYK